jgi:hypothetical protein
MAGWEICGGYFHSCGPKQFWPWLLLLAVMFFGARALRGLELWLPGEPILPRLAAFASRRRWRIGVACIALSLVVTTFLVWQLWPDYRQWQGTPRFWLLAMVLFLIGAWLLSAVGRGSPRAAAAQSMWADTRRNRWLEVLAFVLIFALAIFLRTYRLDSIPAGIYADDQWRAGRAVHPGRPTGPLLRRRLVWHGQRLLLLHGRHLQAP